MKAISNSSVLIALGTIGKLDLLHQRFPGGIIIPQAVWYEVVETGEDYPGAREVASASFIEVCQVENTSLVSLLLMDLDNGEAEAIVLCQEKKASTILLDEKDARQVARRLGLPVLGTVGVLIWAKKAGLITNLRDQLDTLQSNGKFRLSRLVYDRALRAARELE